MKILFLGEYSNVHWTLAEGLRQLGHAVTVVSNGDFWKNYQRDIDLSRTLGKLGGIRYTLYASFSASAVWRNSLPILKSLYSSGMSVQQV